MKMKLKKTKKFDFWVLNKENKVFQNIVKWDILNDTYVVDTELQEGDIVITGETVYLTKNNNFYRLGNINLIDFGEILQN